MDFVNENYIWIAAAIAVLLVILFLVRNARPKDDHIVSTTTDTADTTTPAVPAATSDAATPFLTAPDGAPDNLRQIKGIGPKLASMLQELGVYHFRQIAEWSPEQLATVDAELGKFQGRPERDQWQAQARLLAEGDIKTYEKLHGKLGG